MRYKEKLEKRKGSNKLIGNPGNGKKWMLSEKLRCTVQHLQCFSNRSARFHIYVFHSVIDFVINNNNYCCEWK